MDPVEESRLAWQRAQADLQMAQAVLERAVAMGDGPDVLAKAHAALAKRRAAADEALQRHITQLGKGA